MMQSAFPNPYAVQGNIVAPPQPNPPSVVQGNMVAPQANPNMVAPQANPPHNAVQGSMVTLRAAEEDLPPFDQAPENENDNNSYGNCYE